MCISAVLLLPAANLVAAESGQVEDAAVMSARIDELTKKVEELSRLVTMLMKQPQPAPEAKSRESTPAPAAAQEQGQAPRTEQGTVALGPLRFSGDLRLRLDGTFRPGLSGDSAGNSLPHLQNVRGRYRLRLNFDAPVHSMVSAHGQLSSGPVNNPNTLDQDFSAIATRHPIMISEAWVDFHPNSSFNIQGGKVQEVFADNMRFLFDDDIRFNGFNESFTHTLSNPAAGFRRFGLRGGQYIFTNPNVAIVTPGNLGPTGAIIGSTGRASQMFHQGLFAEQALSERTTQLFGADIQLYRNPNQIQFGSTQAGLPIVVQPPLGVVLSGPLPQTGNATTTSGGSILYAPHFQVARLLYQLKFKGPSAASRVYPICFDFQVARNVGTGAPQRDALMAAIRVGQVQNRWDRSFLYLFAIKGANSMISQFTDDDLGTVTGVNIRAHYLRFDLGLTKRIQLQNLFFIQNELSSSGQYPNYFVPLGATTPRLFRFQEQIIFGF
jgi:hypothetical protein